MHIIVLVRRYEVVTGDGVVIQVVLQLLQRPIIFCFDVGCRRVVAAVCVYEKERSIMFASKVVLMGTVDAAGRGRV
jgi:hypothetical protein